LKKLPKKSRSRNLFNGRVKKRIVAVFMQVDGGDDRIGFTHAMAVAVVSVPTTHKHVGLGVRVR